MYFSSDLTFFNYSVTTDKDTAIVVMDTKPKVDGTFWYLLDDSEPFQQCVLQITSYSHSLRINIINSPGSSGTTLSKLSAGTHRIVFKFIPTDSPDVFSVSKEHQFEIEPTGN